MTTRAGVSANLQGMPPYQRGHRRPAAAELQRAGFEVRQSEKRVADGGRSADRRAVGAELRHPDLGHGETRQKPSLDVGLDAPAEFWVEAGQRTAKHDATGIDVRFTFAGSNTLARQIVEGARIDVFISADSAQMDVVERAGKLVPGSRVDVVSNQLVVITPAGQRQQQWPDALGSVAVKRVAMGDPAAVPAGVYGRQWLETVRLWHDVAGKVVPLPTSPAVLAAVRSGHAQAGILYITDVAGDPQSQGVAIVHRVADADAPDIVYPAAAIVGSRVVDARRMVEFLGSEAALKVFVAAGFRPRAR